MSWQEQKRRSRDAIVAAEPFTEQIRSQGEIHHQGMGSPSRWQRLVEYGRGLYQDAREWLTDTWTEWVGARREQDTDPELELER